MQDTTFHVYGYFNVLNPTGNPFYIGKGSGIRRLVHLNASNLCKKTLFYNTLRKMLISGNAPSIRILHDDLTEPEAFRIEVELISQYGRIDDNSGCLCNHTDGGDGISGHVHSATTRDKMRWSHTGMQLSREQCYNMSLALRGKKCSEESKIKNRESQVTTRRICSYNLDTSETIKIYPSISSVKEDGLSPGTVSNVLHGRRPYYSWRGWRFV